MGKTPTDVENVFRIDLRNGKGRLWCSQCKKFLSEASGGVHDCDPNWRARLQAGRKMAGTNKKRKYKMTPKRMNKIKKITADAAKYNAIKSSIKQIIKSKPNHSLVKKLASSTIDKHTNIYLKSIGIN